GLQAPLQGQFMKPMDGSPWASASRRPGNRTPLLVLPRHADYRLPRRRRDRGEGIEPSFSGSEPDGLPLADPRVIDTSLSPTFGEKESNLHARFQGPRAYH